MKRARAAFGRLRNQPRRLRRATRARVVRAGDGLVVTRRVPNATWAPLGMPPMIGPVAAIRAVTTLPGDPASLPVARSNRVAPLSR